MLVISNVFKVILLFLINHALIKHGQIITEYLVILRSYFNFIMVDIYLYIKWSF